MNYRKVGLIGNPNVGKSALFNALTGGAAKVGNWPGVTVKSQVGSFVADNQELLIVDLPGCYACCSYTEEGALDEEEVMRFILNQSVDVFVNVVDGRYLPRHLYLTCQLLEMGMPLVVVINMHDLLLKQGVDLDVKALELQLGCPVVKVSAKYDLGLDGLKDILLQQDLVCPPILQVPEALFSYHQELVSSMLQIVPNEDSARLNWLARRWLEGDTMIALTFEPKHRLSLQATVDRINSDLDNSVDMLIADQRYNKIQDLLKLVKPVVQDRTLSDAIDKWLLHKWLGLPIFFVVMYLVFAISIGFGGMIQDWLGEFLNLFLAQLPAKAVYLLTGGVSWLAAVVHGVGVGLTTIINLTPVVVIIGVCLFLLEESGYMARAAFLIDRLMLALKLPGRSFIAMILGFGCNVPAISAARTLSSAQDRAMTIMMVPFMSCTARLTVYTALTSVFYPDYGALVVFLLYLLGFFVGLATAWLLRFAWGRVEGDPLIMEFPVYQLPLIRALVKQVFRRTVQFMGRAIKVVVWVSLVLSLLSLGDMRLLLEYLGSGIAFILSPMGMHQEQWPAAIALLFGALAKEVVVGALNTLYAQDNIDVLFAHMNSWSSLWDWLVFEWGNLANIQAVSQVLTSKVKAGLAVGMDNSFAYLSFILLYLPCVSTLAVIAKELSWRWALWGLGWSTLLAYGVSVIIYQFGGIFNHPLNSFLVISLVVGLVASISYLLIIWVRRLGKLL